jgi:nucleotidyltransferase substrate binding protein (TIGR01987 family)
MDKKKDIRWKQRYENFEKAFLQLKDAIERFDQLDDLAKEGLVQRFEYTFELAWKTLKDYLESEGIINQFPREVLKQGFHVNVLNNGELWIDMLEKRNLLTHTYDQDNFNLALELIKKSYFPEITYLYEFFRRKK